MCVTAFDMVFIFNILEYVDGKPHPTVGRCCTVLPSKATFSDTFELPKRATVKCNGWYFGFTTEFTCFRIIIGE